jgi:methanogenic corrinoid protein MtbC1
MATIHDTEALDILTALAAQDFEPSEFRSKLSAAMPGWQGNAAPLQGYSDPAAHTRIKVAKAFFEALEPGYKGIGFRWEVDHGFGPTVVYVEQPSRTAAEVKALTAAAQARAAEIVNAA